MGVKSQKKKLTDMLGTNSGNLEFTENLFDNKLSKASKKVIKNVLAIKHKEAKMIGCSEADRFMRHNLHQFNLNVTDNEKYINCVLEIKNNKKRVKMSNLLTIIRNSKNNRRKK